MTAVPFIFARPAPGPREGSPRSRGALDLLTGRLEFFKVHVVNTPRERDGVFAHRPGAERGWERAAFAMCDAAGVDPVKH